MPPKTKTKEVKKKAGLTTNTSQKQRGGNKNPTGKGGFGDRPQDRNNNGQRSAEVVAFGRSLRELIVTVGEEVTTLPDGRKISKIEGVVRAAYRQAIEGDASARSFIAERVEGKVTQPTELTGKDGAAIQMEAVIDAGIAKVFGEDGTTD